MHSIKSGGVCAEPLYNESKTMRWTVAGDLGTVGIGWENVRRIDFFHIGVGRGGRGVNVGQDAETTRIGPLEVSGLRSFGRV